MPRGKGVPPVNVQDTSVRPSGGASHNTVTEVERVVPNALKAS
jgi:hypothetical protein